jgi:CheY-like chemotaxis protein
MPPQERSPVRILLVEDSEADSYYFRQILREVPLPTTLEVAETGEATLAMLRPPGAPTPPLFDLIVLDLVLPGMSGVDVLAVWHHDPLLRTVPVYVYVGVGEHPALEAIREQGFPIQGVLMKPITVDTLTQIVMTLAVRSVTPAV